MEGERLVRLDYVANDKQPFKAEYVNWETAPIHPRLGLGGIKGYGSESYGFMIKMIIGNLKYLEDKDFPGLALTGAFRSAVGQKLENLTLTLLSRDFLKTLKGNEYGLDDLFDL